MSVAARNALAVPVPVPLSRAETVFALVSIAAYSASMVKAFQRDPLGTDTGAQALIEIALLGVALGAAAVPTFLCRALIPRPTPPVVGFAVFGALAMASSAFSYWLELSLVKSCLFLAVVTMALYLCAAKPPRDILRYFYWSTVTIIVFGACLKFASLQPLFEIDEYSGRQRFSLFEWHPNGLADLAAMTILIGRLLPRRPPLACQFLLFCVVALTGARTVGVALILVLVASSIVSAKAARKMLIAGLAVTAMLLVMWLAILLQPGSHLSITDVVLGFYGNNTGEELQTLNGRLGVWQQVSTFIDGTLVLGYGLDGARALLLNEFEWAGHAHNAYLDILLAGGLPGLVVFLIAWGITIVKTWQMDLSSRRYAMAVHGYIFISGFVDPNFTALQFLPVFLVICLDACARSEAITWPRSYLNQFH